MVEFVLNGKPVRVEVEGDMPLLWALRDTLKMTGTKFGCGQGLCGACTVHLDGQAIRACAMPVSGVAGKHITTIEGLSADGMHALQTAWVARNVPQCGYCQPGQIMQAASLLAKNPSPSDDEIKHAMAGNLCRCGTYSRIHAAIKDAAAHLRGEAPLPETTPLPTVWHYQPIAQQGAVSTSRNTAASDAADPTSTDQPA